jgi:tRNA (cmo5U34)-methyltransferase
MKDSEAYLEKVKRELTEDAETPLEGMSEFFTTRVDSYESHMLGFFRSTYRRFADLVPKHTEEMLDIGCGTGLELDEIFRILPGVRVTGVDLTESMLDVLSRKHPNKHLELIRGNFLDVPLRNEAFDTVISFEALHHFTSDQKRLLYRKVFDAIKPEGCYIECDYVAECEEEANMYFEDREKRRIAAKLPEDALVHYDTPLTSRRQQELLMEAGFDNVILAHEEEATVILIAEKR